MHGLYLLWWVQEQHLSPVVVGTVLALGDFAIMIFELPTGWFADRFGHRVSLIVGSVVQTVGMACCWLGPGIPGLVAACLLVAPGGRVQVGRASSAASRWTAVARSASLASACDKAFMMAALPIVGWWRRRRSA